MSKAAELANLIGNINAGGGGVNRNVIINGAMNVSQRQTSSSNVGNQYVLDRFSVYKQNTDSTYTCSQSSVTDLAGFRNALKMECTTADTSTASNEEVQIRQNIEGQNVQGFAKGLSDAKPFALSFYVKTNKTGVYTVIMFDRDNSRKVSGSYTVSDTNWNRHTITFPADTTGAFDDDNASSLELRFNLVMGSDSNSGTLNTVWGTSTDAGSATGQINFADSTSNVWEITGVQLEVGQNPTEFESEPFERTLAKCQRYYNRHQANTAYDVVCHGHYGSDTQWFGTYFFPTEMRAEPTMAASDSWRIYTGSTVPVNSGTLAFTRATTTSLTMECLTGDNNDEGQGAMMTNNNDSDAHIEFKAEI